VAKKGKELGAFNTKLISFRVKEDEIEFNWEGEIDGYGHGLATATINPADLKMGGSFEWNGVAFGKDGAVSTATVEEGKYESIGPNKWTTTSVTVGSDGTRVLAEGIVDLAAKTWNGKFYEATK
jgi:hypothetical protein